MDADALGLVGEAKATGKQVGTTAVQAGEARTTLRLICEGNRRNSRDNSCCKYNKITVTLAINDDAITVLWQTL